VATVSIYWPGHSKPNGETHRPRSGRGVILIAKQMRVENQVTHLRGVFSFVPRQSS